VTVADFQADIRGGKGPASSLFLSESTPKPVPGPGEVLVKVKYFGLNRMDLGQRAGNYPIPPQASHILGVEFSGIIEEAEPDENDSFNVGDEVFGLAYGGKWIPSHCNGGVRGSHPRQARTQSTSRCRH
jgi:NADPH:quinone reductase-like Zn-dependent oxidoreductase